MAAPLISLRDVSLVVSAPDGTRRALLDRVTLDVAAGEFVYLIGPTGSGKSTLLRLIYADARPDFGTVRVGDYRFEAMRPAEIPYLRRTLGVVFQDFQLLPDRTVAENVAFPLYVTGVRGSAIKTRALTALARVGLAHKQHRHPHELSGGEQQRAAIARAIVGNPRIVLADEPTGNLDPAVADEIMGLLVALNRQGVTLIVATHDYRTVQRHPARTLAIESRTLAEVDPLALSRT